MRTFALSTATKCIAGTSSVQLVVSENTCENACVCSMEIATLLPRPMIV